MKATVRQGRSMGSALRLTVPGNRPREADAAWAAVRHTFSVAEADLGRFDPASALSQLNRGAGHPRDVPRTLARALAAAWRAYRMSGGRFDPRIIGALEAAGEHAGVALPASPARLGRSDRWLHLDARAGRATIAAPVDLGGIGKGLALRWSAATLRAAGMRDFLVQAGGDIVASGQGPGDRPWIVRIDDPTGAGEEITMHLVDRAVATSSVSVRQWSGEDGTLRHHLIDPATLRPAPPTWVSVTATHRDPAWAEVISKVGFLAGDGIGRVLDGRPAWWRAPDGRLHASPAADDAGTPRAPWYALPATATRRPAEDA